MEDREFDPEPSVKDFYFFGTVNEFFGIRFLKELQAETAGIVLLDFWNVGVRESLLDIELSRIKVAFDNVEDNLLAEVIVDQLLDLLP